MRGIIAVSVATLALALAGAANGASGVCSGPQGLAGEVIISSFAPGTVQLQWTVWEDSSTREYRLTRYASGCDRPRCAIRLAKVRPGGQPPGFQTYAFTDTAPLGAWRYRLEVVRTRGDSCTMQSAELVVDTPPACDAAALCAQVEASFAGTVILSGAAADAVSLRWVAHAETGAGSYRLSRFNCVDPRDCSTEVATVDATGSCGQVMLHSVTDAVPGGAWTYALDVLDSGGRTACTMRLPAPASPASSR